MADTPKLVIPQLSDQQDNAEVTHNNALRLLEAIAHGVIDRDLTAPPGGESDGDVYIPKATATGTWAGKENNIAYYSGTAYKFVAPVEGMRIWIADEDTMVIWDGSAWIATHGHQTLTDAATVNWDASLGAGAQVTFAGNRTMAAPTNLEAGRRYALTCIQDPTGTRVPTWNAVFRAAGGTMPTLSTGANARDLLEFYSPDGTNLDLIASALNIS